MSFSSNASSHPWGENNTSGFLQISERRQEIYIRVYEAAQKSRPPQPKSFLFRTAGTPVWRVEMRIKDPMIPGPAATRATSQKSWRC